MIDAAEIDQVLRAAGIPIVGVSVPSDDKGTWLVHFADGATKAHEEQALAAIDAFKPPTPAALLDRQAKRETSEQKLQAVALALWECIPEPALTKAQLKARIIAIYKTL